MKYLKDIWLILAFISTVIMLSGCYTKTTEGNTKTLTVFIAASLNDVMESIGRQFEEINPGVKIIFNPAGSQTLRTQIEQGAYADVFISADERNIKPLFDNGLVEKPKKLIYNKLIIIAYKDSRVSNFMDIKNSRLKLALADESVPAGKYAMEILTKIDKDNHGFKDSVLKNVVTKEITVTDVVQKVAMGEADAGIVYVTDAKKFMDKVKVIYIPDKYNVIATYFVAAVKRTKDMALSYKFIDYILNGDGRYVLEDYGFITSK